MDVLVLWISLLVVQCRATQLDIIDWGNASAYQLEDDFFPENDRDAASPVLGMRRSMDFPGTPRAQTSYWGSSENPQKKKLTADERDLLIAADGLQNIMVPMTALQQLEPHDYNAKDARFTIGYLFEFLAEEARKTVTSLKSSSGRRTFFPTPIRDALVKACQSKVNILKSIKQAKGSMNFHVAYKKKPPKQPGKPSGGSGSMGASADANANANANANGNNDDSDEPDDSQKPPKKNPNGGKPADKKPPKKNPGGSKPATKKPPKKNSGGKSGSVSRKRPRKRPRVNVSGKVSVSTKRKPGQRGRPRRPRRRTKRTKIETKNKKNKNNPKKRPKRNPGERSRSRGGSGSKAKKNYLSMSRKRPGGRPRKRPGVNPAVPELPVSSKRKPRQRGRTRPRRRTRPSNIDRRGMEINSLPNPKKISEFTEDSVGSITGNMDALDAIIKKAKIPKSVSPEILRKELIKEFSRINKKASKSKNALMGSLKSSPRRFLFLNPAIFDKLSQQCAAKLDLLHTFLNPDIPNFDIKVSNAVKMNKVSSKRWKGRMKRRPLRRRPRRNELSRNQSNQKQVIKSY